MSTESVTIYDIAREANVSIATVSRVFSASKQVSEHTKKRVLSVADRFGYRPQATAQNLASKKRKNVAIVVPVISNYFFIELLAGIQDELSACDLELNIININSKENLFEQVEGVLRKRYADAYIFISIHFDIKEWEALTRYKAPIILVDDFYKDFDSVSVDNITGAYLAVSHFLEQGCKKVAMLSASSSSKPIKERSKGYLKALEHYAIPFQKNLVFELDQTYRDGFTEEAGYQTMREMLESKMEFDACFCTSDAQAIGALHAMRKMKREIPIIGFDDIKIAHYMGLSSMRQPIHEMGVLAVRKIASKLGKVMKKPSHIIFKPELVVRESSVVAK